MNRLHPDPRTQIALIGGRTPIYYVTCPTCEYLWRTGSPAQAEYVRAQHEKTHKE